MRLLLVNPARVGRGQSSVRFVDATPLALPTLRALTPGGVEVRIVDEGHEPVPYDEPWDLVGITTMLHVWPQAQSIAEGFRARGVPVVLGGMFPSLWPEQVAPHVDSIVVGEAEAVWADVIRDAEAGRLQPRYQADRLVDMARVPFIPADCFPVDDPYYSIESTRGCPFDCDHCTVTAQYGASFRHRPIDHVLRQLEAFEGRWVSFVDDNITGDPRYARELFTEMIPLKRKWNGQFSLHYARDASLIELAARSGCQMLFTGIESLDADNLRAVNKRGADPALYVDWIRTVHDAGIAVYASFMFGFELDEPDVFQRTLEFCERNEIELALFSSVVTYEGGAFHRQLVDEGRLFETDLARFNGQYATYHPRGMTAAQLEDGLSGLWRGFYSRDSIRSRLARVLQQEKAAASVERVGGLSRGEVLLALNAAFRRAADRF
jgi:radical SAM superfamily enzyme YgiQ (UPF0313 family)